MLRLGIILAMISALAIAGASWLKSQTSSPETAKAQTPGSSDYYMKEANAYQLNMDGELSYRMKVREALHFPDGFYRLDKVRVHYVENTPTYWDLKSGKGHIPASENEIYLYDQVFVKHPRDNGNMMRLKTRNAWVRPDEDRIDTKEHVVSIEPGQTVHGDGMNVNLKTNQLNLLDNVHVNYSE